VSVHREIARLPFGKLVNGVFKKPYRSGKLAIAPLKIPKFALVSSLA
jgi:hypothetical protein